MFALAGSARAAEPRSLGTARSTAEETAPSSADDVPRFSVTVGGVRPGSPAEGHCLGDLVPPGLPVVLLGADGRTCPGRTGARGEALAGGSACTFIEVGGCELQDVVVAVLGAPRDAVALLRREPVDAQRAQAAAAKLVSADAIAVALARPEEWASRSRPVVDRVPSAVFTLEGHRSGPVFARYGARLDGGPVPGPLLVLEQGRPATPFSACAAEPVAFRVGRRTFVKGGSVCCDCGQLRDEIFAVANGGIRRVYASSARSE